MKTANEIRRILTDELGFIGLEGAMDAKRMWRVARYTRPWVHAALLANGVPHKRPELVGSALAISPSACG